MIECKICGRLFKAINKRHLVHHNITRDEYIQLFPDAPLQSEESKACRKEASLKREAAYSIEDKQKRAEKISQSRQGQSSWNKGKGGYTLTWSEEAKARCKEREPWNKGISPSEETRLKISKARTDGFAAGHIVHWNTGNTTPEEVCKKISDANKGQKLTPEQAEKHLQAMRNLVASPTYKNAMKGRHHSDEAKEKIGEMMSGDASGGQAVRATMEERGYWIPLDQLPELTIYRRKVWGLTNKVAHLIPGYDPAKRGLNSKTEDNWQVDHRLSITEGFKAGLTPAQVSHLVNLRFIPWRDNNAKWHHCDLTKEELLALIEEEEKELT